MPQSFSWPTVQSPAFCTFGGTGQAAAVNVGQEAERSHNLRRVAERFLLNFVHRVQIYRVTLLHLRGERQDN